MCGDAGVWWYDSSSEGCGLKHPHYGLVAEGKRRWCGGCAKQEEGAV
eukprot:SAG22_NODE_4024_length_1417_cov_2.218513_1_plen_46_part_10